MKSVFICANCYRSSLGDSEDTNIICSKCNSSMIMAKDINPLYWGSYSDDKRREIIETFLFENALLGSDVTSEDLAERVKKRQEQRQKDAERVQIENEQKRKEQIKVLEEKRRKKIEQQVAYATEIRNKAIDQFVSGSKILTTTGTSFEGYEIVDYIDIIQGETFVPNGLLGVLTSGTFFTIDALTKARRIAMENLKKEAEKFDANGIIGVDVDISDLNGNGILVSANGTAVKVAIKE